MTRPENLAGSCEAALDVPLLYFLLGLKRNLLSRVVRVESEPPPLERTGHHAQLPPDYLPIPEPPYPPPYGMASPL
jgi:hypothetical protein